MWRAFLQAALLKSPPIGLSSCAGGTSTRIHQDRVADGATLMELMMHGSSGAPYVKAGQRDT